MVREVSNGLNLSKLRAFIHDKPNNIELNNEDVFIVFLLTCVSFIIHFWNLQNPSSVVFDEIYFGNFTNFYLHRQFFFDIHPPLAKLIITLFAYLSEYDGNIQFSKVYEYPNADYISLRITPIIFSSLTTPFIYLSIRFASFSKYAALISSSLILFDTSYLCEGKFILTDGILHFFVSCCMFSLNYWLSINQNDNLSLIMMYITSFLLGCSFSIKYTSLSLCFVIGFTQLIMIIDRSNYIFNEETYRQICIRTIELFLPAVVIHILFWMIHLILIPYSTSYTSKFDIQTFNLLNYSNLSTICNNFDDTKKKYFNDDCLDKSSFIQSPLLISRIFSTIILIQFSNMMNYQPHSSMSRPKDWPLLTDVFVTFWKSGESEIDCIGNIFVYYFSFFGVFLVIIYGLIFLFPFSNLKFAQKSWIKAMRFVIGFFSSYLPFFLVPRTLYLYHYLIPLLFASMSFGAAIDLFLPPLLKGVFSSVVLFFVIFGFFFWAPLVYGEPLSDEDRKIRIWNDAWIHGNKGRRAWVKYMQDQYELVKKQMNT